LYFLPRQKTDPVRRRVMNVVAINIHRQIKETEKELKKLHLTLHKLKPYKICKARWYWPYKTVDAGWLWSGECYKVQVWNNPENEMYGDRPDGHAYYRTLPKKGSPEWVHLDDIVNVRKHTLAKIYETMKELDALKKQLKGGS